MIVEFFRHNVGEPELARLAEVFKGAMLTTGSYVSQFERLFAEYLNAPHAVGVTSCTAALHLSLLALGIGPGDEVITTPLTFVATANAIIHAGATPIFCDVEASTGNLDASRVEAAITSRTRAILPVHLYGQMCDMRALRRIADKHRLVIIEDCAHCIEGERDGVRPGQLSEAACFSFYATKNITSGEGGAVAVRDARLADRLKVLRLHGMTRGAEERYTKGYEHWDVEELGWKYNMDNIHAALLLEQLPRIDAWLARREAICQRYEAAFAGNDGIGLLQVVPGSRSARHLFTIQVEAEQRDAVLKTLEKSGVKTVVNYRAVHLLSYYRKHYGFERGMYSVAERIGDTTLSLPLYPRLTDEQVEYVIARVQEAVQVACAGAL